MSQTAVVIINWNKSLVTRRCLNAARLATSVPVRWIIVDNGSQEPLGNFTDEVTILRNNSNLGFSGGANTGLNFAFSSGANHVWLLNNDTEPLPGALDALLAVAGLDPKIGLASSVILNIDAQDAVEFHGGRFSAGIYETTSKSEVYKRWSDETPDRIWLLGTSLLISRDVFEQVGKFDERLFAYWEDADFSRRSAAAGFRNVVVSASRVRHSSGNLSRNPGERPPYYYYYMTRNEFLLLKKTGDIGRVRSLYWYLRRTGRLYLRLRAYPQSRRAVRMAIIHAVLGRGGALVDFVINRATK